ADYRGVQEHAARVSQVRGSCQLMCFRLRRGDSILASPQAVKLTMEKIDLHTHILPPAWPGLRQRYGYAGFVPLERHRPGCARMMIDGRCFREIEDNCWNPHRRLEECDKHGVTLQVLSTVPVMFSYWAKPRDTFDLSRLLNDHLAEIVAATPHRFAGLGTVP